MFAASADPPPSSETPREARDELVEQAVRHAVSHDAGLSEGLARRLAREAVTLLAADQTMDAPALARALMREAPEAGATPANVVAVAVLESLAD